MIRVNPNAYVYSHQTLGYRKERAVYTPGLTERERLMQVQNALTDQYKRTSEIAAETGISLPNVSMILGLLHSNQMVDCGCEWNKSRPISKWRKVQVHDSV